MHYYKKSSYLYSGTYQSTVCWTKGGRLFSRIPKPSQQVRTLNYKGSMWNYNKMKSFIFTIFLHTSLFCFILFILFLFSVIWMDIYHNSINSTRISSFACQNGFLKVVVLKGNGTDFDCRFPYIYQPQPFMIWRRAAWILGLPISLLL